MDVHKITNYYSISIISANLIWRAQMVLSWPAQRIL